MRRTLPLAVALALGWLGCRSTEQIEALPPSPGIAVPPDTIEASLANFSVSLRTEGSLAQDVDRFRFRIVEVRLRPRDGAWRSFPASSGPIAVSGPISVNRNVLTTRIPAQAYDSLEVIFGDLNLEFAPNVGTRLMAGVPPSTSRAIALDVEQPEGAEVLLTLNLPASLMRDPECRWHFVPFLRVSIE